MVRERVTDELRVRVRVRGVSELPTARDAEESEPSSRFHQD